MIIVYRFISNGLILISISNFLMGLVQGFAERSDLSPCPNGPIHRCQKLNRARFLRHLINEGSGKLKSSRANSSRKFLLSSSTIFVLWAHTHPLARKPSKRVQSSRRSHPNPRYLLHPHLNTLHLISSHLIAHHLFDEIPRSKKDPQNNVRSEARRPPRARALR